MASSTLDASAKIYAGRVDAIHNETFKVLTGLGRKNEKGGKDGDMDADEGAPGEEGVGKRKGKRRRKGVKETNLKNINKKADKKAGVQTAIEDYPYVHKAAANFEEGSGGLYLNHWSCVDESGFVMLNDGPARSELPEHAKQVKDIATTEEKQELGNLDLEVLQICPEFSTFSMTNWSPDGQDGFTSILTRQEKASDHRFDVNAVVDLPSTLEEPADDVDDNDMMMDDFTGNEDDNAPSMDLASETGEEHVPDTKETQLIETAMRNMKQGCFRELMQVLTSGSTDYSYLKTNILNSWAGPNHWKAKPKSRDEMTRLEDKERRKRKRKEPFRVVFDEDHEKLELLFKETRKTTTLTKRTLTKNSKQHTTLPEDLRYELEGLIQLPVEPKPIAQLNKTIDDDGLDDYDYDNPNDKENFVPDLLGGDEGEDDGDTMGGFDFTQSQEANMASQEMASQDDLNTSIFRGDNYVEQPQLVAKIDIGYAKTAKKVDVKKLKNSIWSLLSEPEPGQSEAGKASDPTPGPSGEGSSRVCGEHRFSCLVKDLPRKVSRTMAKNISVPIAFVCLLHLANERTLEIEDVEDMSDLTINQGLVAADLVSAL